MEIVTEVFADSEIILKNKNNNTKSRCFVFKCSLISYPRSFLASSLSEREKSGARMGCCGVPQPPHPSATLPSIAHSPPFKKENSMKLRGENPMDSWERLDLVAASTGPNRA